MNIKPQPQPSIPWSTRTQYQENRTKARYREVTLEEEKWSRGAALQGRPKKVGGERKEEERGSVHGQAGRTEPVPR